MLAMHAEVGFESGWCWVNTVQGGGTLRLGGAGADLTTVLGPEGNVYNYVVVHVGKSGLGTEVMRLMNGQWVRTQLPEPGA